MKKTLATLFALCFALGLTVTLTGCNTVQGAGKDIQKAGNAIEGAAAKKKDY